MNDQSANSGMVSVEKVRMFSNALSSPKAAAAADGVIVTKPLPAHLAKLLDQDDGTSDGQEHLEVGRSARGEEGEEEEDVESARAGTQGQDAAEDVG